MYAIDLWYKKNIQLNSYINLMKLPAFKHIKYLVTLIALFFSFSYASAAGLELQKIGALDLGGKMYSEWWYTGTNPTFVGLADIGSTVNVKIGETQYTSTPDAAGAWSLATTLEKGDYNIEITQGESKIIFVLHLGQSMPSGIITSGSTPAPTEVPETGFNQYLAMSFGMGIILLSTYLYFSSGSRGKTVFESRMLKED